MSLDLTTFLGSMLDMASSIFNALIPVMAIILGITIGIGLVFMIYKILKGAFPSS